VKHAHKLPAKVERDGTIQRRRDLISKRTQIIHGKRALLATAQMISNKLKLITREILINILGRLFAREMRTVTLGQRFITHRKKRGINIQRSLDPRPTLFTFTKMIARRQQLRAAQAIPGVVLNLFLTQVFHRFFF
jgi:hypothetical protein